MGILIFLIASLVLKSTPYGRYTKVIIMGKRNNPVILDAKN